MEEEAEAALQYREYRWLNRPRNPDASDSQREKKRVCDSDVCVTPSESSKGDVPQPDRACEYGETEQKYSIC